MAVAPDWHQFHDMSPPAVVRLTYSGGEICSIKQVTYSRLIYLLTKTYIILLQHASPPASKTK